MEVLGIILARAGSKGLPDKCARDLLGRPVIEYTFEHAAASRRLSATVFSTDSEPLKTLARRAGVEVIDRPEQLATDTAAVDAAARHAVETWEGKYGRRVDAVVLLYGNIPVRAPGLIDRAIEQLVATGAGSVRSVAPATKQHPDWMFRLDGDRMTQLRQNSIHRRQELEPLCYHDGAVAAVTRGALFGALETPGDHQAFLGRDRRALIQEPEDAVDIDGPIDIHLAEAILRARGKQGRALCRGEHGANPPVAIGRHRIGPGEPTFIVAEAGVNHNGSLETALRMVDVAVDAGADAVKFQMFRAVDLVTASTPTAGYQKDGCGDVSQGAMLSRLELSCGQFKTIKKRCDQRSILFLATPFSEEDVARLSALGVAAIKIASTDLPNEPLLAAAATTGLPLILSTGASTEEEISAAARNLRRCGAGGRLILLHCVSCYPTPLEAVNLRAIASLGQAFEVPCGFSDHSMSTQTGGWAVSAGAYVLEKHFTLDPTAKGPDHGMSLDPGQLTEYIAAARQAEKTLGMGTFGLSELEADVRNVARRSIVTTRAIPAGTVLTEKSLTLKRPGTGIAPGELSRVVHCRALVDIPSDTLLSWDMLA